MLNSCLFAVQLADPALRPAIDARLERLVRFYAPLGEPFLSSRFLEEPRVVLGAIRFDGREVDLGRPLAWGGRPPGHLDSVKGLIEAGDRDLRVLDHGLALIAAAEAEACVIGGAGGAASLYASDSPEAEAWSTHAVAAAWLATGEARVDADALPDFLAGQFVGGEQAMIRGARALRPAARVRLTAAGAERWTFWPGSERWALVPEPQAQDHTERALLDALDRRVPRRPTPFCGLTAGLDSRVAAVALREVGVGFEAFTWRGIEPDVDDARAAVDVARHLGIGHRHQPYTWWEDREALRQIDAGVRWSEGAMQAGLGEPSLPREMSAFVTGEGGEAGRCFYYRNSTRTYPRATTEQVTRVLAAEHEERIVGARPEALGRVRRSVEAWVGDAEALGHRGWRLLDVVFMEEGVRRWGRAMLARGSPPVVPAFATPEISRGLVSLPLGERLASGFHRRFLAERLPALAPPPGGAPQRRGVPPPARRLAARLRRTRQRRATRRSLIAGEWASRPALRAWIADEVLRSPLLTEAMGERWTGSIRRGFLADEDVATDLALWAASPVALHAALSELRAPSTYAPASSPR